MRNNTPLRAEATTLFIVLLAMACIGYFLLPDYLNDTEKVSYYAPATEPQDMFAVNMLVGMGEAIGSCSSKTSDIIELAALVDDKHCFKIISDGKEHVCCQGVIGNIKQEAAASADTK